MPRHRKPDIAHSPLAAACANAFMRLAESYDGRDWRDLFEAVALEVPDATSDDLRAGLALAVLMTQHAPKGEAELPDTGEPPRTVH